MSVLKFWTVFILLTFILNVYFKTWCKKPPKPTTTANHAAAISHKHWCEAALEKLDCLRKGGDSRVSGCTRLNCRVMLILKSRDFSCTFWIIQIYFSDSGRFLCVNAHFGASIHLILFFVSNNGKQNFKKCGIIISLRTIKICRFEIIDGVIYVYCIKHAYFLLREQVGFADVLWRMRQCVSCSFLYETQKGWNFEMMELNTAVGLYFHMVFSYKEILCSLTVNHRIVLERGVRRNSNIFKRKWYTNAFFLNSL